MLFNIFINNLFHFIKDAQLQNFTDDNTIVTFSESVEDLVKNINIQGDFQICISRVKTTKFAEKSLRILGPKIWNFLLEDIKDLTSLPKFTEFIKT